MSSWNCPADALLWYAMRQFAPGTKERLILYHAYLYVIFQEADELHDLRVEEST